MPRVDDQRVWTAADLDEIYAGDGENDVDWRRFEIVDGALLVSPPPAPRHELVVATLIRLLAPAVLGHRVIGSVGITMGRSFRVTDVTVVADCLFDQVRGPVRPDDVLLAVEIGSPSSVTTDRITKPAQYAAAGIAHYWRVETGPLRLNAYELAGEVAQIEQPFRVDVEIAQLAPPSTRHS